MNSATPTRPPKLPGITAAEATKNIAAWSALMRDALPALDDLAANINDAMQSFRKQAGAHSLEEIKRRLTTLHAFEDAEQVGTIISRRKA